MINSDKCLVNGRRTSERTFIVQGSINNVFRPPMLCKSCYINSHLICVEVLLVVVCMTL